MNFLFVGGAIDGQWRTVPEGKEYFQVLVETNWRHSFENIDEALDQTCEPFKTQTYCKQRYRSETQDFTLYALERLTGAQVLEKLIENYRPEPKPEPTLPAMSKSLWLHLLSLLPFMALPNRIAVIQEFAQKIGPCPNEHGDLLKALLEQP